MAQLKANTTIGGRTILQEFDNHTSKTASEEVHGLRINAEGQLEYYSQGQWVVIKAGAGAETPAGAQAKADAALAAAKAYTDQQISAITPEQIGAETPTGAQAKANQAEANAKAYTEQQVSTVANDLASHKNDYATLNNLGHIKHAVLTATLDTAWEGEEAPYTKTITVNGIQATDTPIIDVVMSGNFATDEQRIEAWGYIYRAVTGSNSITFYATEKPTIDLPIQIKVVR